MGVLIMGFVFALQVFLALLPLSQLANIDDEYETFKDYKLYEVEGDRDDLDNLVEYLRNFDRDLVYSDDRMPAQILVSPSLDPKLEFFTAVKKMKIKLVVDDYSKIIELERAPTRRKDGGFVWDAYHDIDEIDKYLYDMSKTYPEFTEAIVGGTSYEKRSILGLRINTPRKAEDTGPEGKPAIFIESGIHAREWIAPATTTYFINQLLTSSDPEIVSMRNQFDWHIFPVVNPDGYHYTFAKFRFWRKTRSQNQDSSCECWGADPNRNWDHNWMRNDTDSDCCSDTYGGSSVFSEIETKSLSQYISKVKNLKAYIGFHSDAKMLLVPYSDSTEHIDNYDDLIKIGKTSLDYGYKVNGARYRGPATAAEILYHASGGSMDWVRQALGTPLVYTYELRSEGGMFVWPPSKIYQQGNEVTQMLLGLVTEAKNLGYL